MMKITPTKRKATLTPARKASRRSPPGRVASPAQVGVTSPATRAIEASALLQGSPMIKKATASIPHIYWNDGRPRFKPGPTLRALGYKSRNLVHPDGRFFTFEEASAESDRIRAEALGRREAAAAGRRLPRPVNPHMGKTLGQLCEACFSLPEFQGKAIVDGRKHRKGLSPKTVEGYRKSCRAVEQAAARMAASPKAVKAGSPSLWDTPAAAFSQKLAQALLDEVERHSGLHQARAVRAFLSQTWGRLAAREPGVNKHVWQEIEKLPVPEGRVRPWTVDEFVIMTDTADRLSQFLEGEADRPELGDCFVLGVLTVLRQTDRLSLTAVADAGTHLKVRTSKTGQEVELLKTPLLSKRLAAAAERRAAWTAGNVAPIKPDPHLIMDEQARQPFHASGDHYRKLFARVRQAAAKRLESCATLRDQDLRDTAQTWLDRAGVDGRIIARLAGHSPETAATMQARHYIEADRRAADAGLAALNSLLEGKL